MTIEERNALAVHFEPLVRKMVYGLMASWHIPDFVGREDVKQDVILRLLIDLPKYQAKNGAKLTTFLHWVIRRDIMDAIDKQWRPDRSQITKDFPAHERSLPPIARSTLKKALTKKQLQAWDLIAIYGFTQEKAAEKLNTDARSVRRILSRAIARLKNLSLKRP